MTIIRQALDCALRLWIPGWMVIIVENSLRNALRNFGESFLKGYVFCRRDGAHSSLCISKRITLKPENTDPWIESLTMDPTDLVALCDPQDPISNVYDLVNGEMKFQRHHRPLYRSSNWTKLLSFTFKPWEQYAFMFQNMRPLNCVLYE